MDNRNLSDDQSDERGGQLELPTVSASGSPFDALRQEDERGEFWSARDVMPHLDYEQWRRFVDSIDRAMAACRNSGDIVEDHFAASGKITINARGHKRVLDDYRLSRHGAYLVAINGDSRKEAIANAQTYFAQQTRKQELAEQAAEVVSPRLSMDLANINDLEQIGVALIRAVEIAKRERAQREIEAAGRQAAEEEIAVLEGPAAQAHHHRAADGHMTVGDLANKLKAWAKDECNVKVYHDDVWEFCRELGLLMRSKNTVRKNRVKAFALDNGYMREKDSEHEGKDGKVHTNHTPRITPKGEGYIWDRATKRIADTGTLKPAKADAA